MADVGEVFELNTLENAGMGTSRTNSGSEKDMDRNWFASRGVNEWSKYEYSGDADG